MIYYAIVRKSDGAFMPQGRARGFTHDTPTLEKPPRLFTTRGAARLALRCWLLGEWSEVSTGDSFGDSDVRPEPPKVRPLDRRSEDMDVVPVRVERAE